RRARCQAAIHNHPRGLLTRHQPRIIAAKARSGVRAAVTVITELTAKAAEHQILPSVAIDISHLRAGMPVEIAREAILPGIDHDAFGAQQKWLTVPRLFLSQRALHAGREQHPDKTILYDFHGQSSPVSWNSAANRPGFRIACGY